jgi:hypothetical protein
MPLESYSNRGKHSTGELLCRTHDEAIGVAYKANGYGRFQRLLAGRNPEQIRTEQRPAQLVGAEAWLRGASVGRKQQRC